MREMDIILPPPDFINLKFGDLGDVGGWADSKPPAPTFTDNNIGGSGLNEPPVDPTFGNGGIRTPVVDDSDQEIPTKITKTNTGGIKTNHSTTKTPDEVILGGNGNSDKSDINNFFSNNWNKYKKPLLYAALIVAGILILKKSSQ